jgi:hypothetical protein
MLDNSWEFSGTHGFEAFNLLKKFLFYPSSLRPFNPSFFTLWTREVSVKAF